MKRLLSGILVILFVLTGCGSNDDKEAEEALKEKIRAEIKAEIEGQEEAQDKVVDIEDKESVIEFIFQQFELSDYYEE